MRTKRIYTLLLCLLLTVSLAFAAGCGKDKPEAGNAGGEATVLGEGEKVFDLTVTDADGQDALFEVHTDKTTVGDALLEVELIDGEQGQYGLYVKTVNGIEADADKDQAYWAFYVNGEYATYGVDLTEIIDGDSYAFKYETI